MNCNGEKDYEKAIVKVGAQPDASECHFEITRWQRFAAIVLPWLKQSRDLAALCKKAAKIRVEREEAEAKKIVEEATKIETERTLLKQQEAKEFNDLVADIFAINNVHWSAKQLMLAKLLEANPELMTQLEKINQLLDMLESTRGVHIVFTQNRIELKRLRGSIPASERDEHTSKTIE